MFPAIEHFTGVLQDHDSHTAQVIVYSRALILKSNAIHNALKTCLAYRQSLMNVNCPNFKMTSWDIQLVGHLGNLTKAIRTGIDHTGQA